MKVAITSQEPKYHYQFQTTDKGIIGIYGISGSGKSNLLDAIAGYQNNIQGIIKFNNKRLQGIVKCAYMNQKPILFPHWTVKENLDFTLKHSSQDNNKYKKLLKLLNCEKLINKLPKQLSGGEKQRIAFIRALIQIENNSLVLLDEPFSALDTKLRSVALKLLKQFKKRCLILLVTHDITELYHVADEFLYVQNGAISYHNNIQNAMSSNHNSLPLASHININNKRLLIYANDVSISLEKNKNSSISHQLKVIIEEINPMDEFILLKLKLNNEQSAQHLYAKITPESLTRLKLSNEQKVFACFKQLAVL